MNTRHLLWPLFKIENHMNLADRTSLILKNDGYKDIDTLLHSTHKKTGKTYLTIMTEGTKDADLPYSRGYICHMLHFHHPWSHRGYLTKKSSATVTSKLFTKAVNYWQSDNKDKAIYQLGRAVHLIQDIFIPQHAGITSRKGHGQLEQWLMENWQQYQINNGGYYDWDKTFCNQDDCHHVISKNPYDWIDYGSHISIDWYNRYFAKGSINNDIFSKLAPLIISNTLRFSAGFIYKFFKDVERYH